MLKCWNAYLSKSFVKLSAICSFDLQKSKELSFLFSNFVIKWYLVSMWLVFLWRTWFFDNVMDELLSHNIVVGSCCSYKKYFNILLSHIAWQDVLVVVAYYAFAEERITMGCFLDAHDTIHVPKWNLYLEVLLLSYRLPPHSLSVYPMSLKSSEVEYLMLKSSVPFTYLRILFRSF